MTDAEITSLIEEVATLKKQVSDKDDVIAKLNGELTRLRNKMFGHTSEKHLPMDPAQRLLFDQKEMSESERAALEADVKKAEDTITYTVTRNTKPLRKPLDDSKLEVVETHICPDSTCDETGKLKPEYVEIGTEETRTLERGTARVFISSTVRHKVILKSDIENELPEDKKILIAELPLQPVSRCVAGASVLHHISYAVATLLIQYDHTQRGIPREPDFKGKQVDSGSNMVFPIKSQKFDLAKLNEALTYESQKRYKFYCQQSTLNKIDLVDSLKLTGVN